MKLKKIVSWLDKVLKPEAFKDASLNGLQIPGADEIAKVAFAVDGSVRSVLAAAESGAQLLVVHHGILWRGHVRPLPEGMRNVRDAAAAAGVALYASHLPLDANREVGNNWELARHFGLADVKPAFSYHGNVIGVTGLNRHGKKIGICSGGAGSSAADAQALGCDLYVTGEASWEEKIAAENLGQPMVCGGHYETETFGVKALMGLMKRELKVAVAFVTLMLALALPAEGFYAGASGQLVLPQGGGDLRRLGGGAVNAGYYFSDTFALEGEAAALENKVALAARALGHFRAWNEFDMLFGCERFDPFATVGARGWLGRGDVGPSVGLGAFYYLTEAWALRFDADATLGVERENEMVYTLTGGIHYAF